jgi:hypothetical protein
VSTAQETVITPRLAKQLGGERGAERCTSSPSLGRFCGPTQSVVVAVADCRRVEVRAIVARLPKRIGAMIVGSDALQRARAFVTFGRRLRVTCRKRE